MHLREWIHHHILGFMLIMFCAWLSLSLIVRLWLKHPNDSLLKKIFWSFVLCVPYGGWIFYGAFYTPLSENDVRVPPNLYGH